MLHFQPQYASPRIRSATSDASSGHELQGAIAPELQNLTPGEVDILDTMIQRAGPSASTFFPVFKAYADVLREQNLNTEEAVYYGKLLKIGTMKGKNWGEKWEIVKAQLEYPAPIFPSDRTAQSESADSRTSDEQYILPSRQARRVLPRRPHAVDAPAVLSKLSSAYSQRPSSEKLSNIEKLPVIDSKEDILSALTQRPKPKLPTRATVTSDDEAELSSPVPPSYKSTLPHAILPAPLLRQRLEGGYPRAESAVIGKTILSAPKERLKPVADLDDAWKNIEMERNEKYADEYRESVLLGRCWEIWKQGYLWITTTHQQIQEARDKVLLRLFIHKWQERMLAQRVAEDKLVAQFSKRHLKHAVSVWQSKLRQKRQAAWRNDMRQKMRVVKHKSELRIKREVWMKWQQLLLLTRAHKHYELGLLFRHHTRWKEKRHQHEGLENVADEYARNADARGSIRFWELWKRKTHLQHRETIVLQRVNCRLMAEFFDLWRKRLDQSKTANVFNSRHILKRAILRWKLSEDSVKALEHRARKYAARQDESLLRAISRIWRVRMRGRRLEQFKAGQILKEAFNKWRYRLAKEGAQLDVAQNFLNRTNARVAMSAFQRWHQVLATHQNAAGYAVKYDEAHLQARMLLLWRVRLHDNIQSVKVARWANRYFATRKAWQTWLRVLEERKRQKHLEEFNLAKVRRLFDVWKKRARETQYYRQCEMIIRDRVEARIVVAALGKWTNRVIEIKSRELDIAHQADMALQRAAWLKWNSCKRKHFEEVSLLENHLLVKREDILRRAFQRWLTVRRAAEHRRLTHQRKEAHLRQVAIASAWERWRERFNEERLRPLEYQVIIDNQRNVLLRAFKIWLSKTDSLPAVKFHSKHLKEKFFGRWRKAMPNAMRTKKARETDRYNTLARHFDKWAQTYKTKTTLKAVARAKYLRLPASTTRQPIPPPAVRSRPLYSASNSIFPGRRPPTPEDEESDARDLDVVVPIRRSFITRPPTTSRARSEKSPSRSEYAPSVSNRQPSPVRSIVSMPGRSTKSPAPRHAPSSVGDTAIESDRLWSAIRRVGQTRRPRAP